MAKIGEMWVTIRLGRTPQERRQLEEDLRERVHERHERHREWIRGIQRLGYTIEPIDFGRRGDR